MRTIHDVYRILHSAKCSAVLHTVPSVSVFTLRNAHNQNGKKRQNAPKLRKIGPLPYSLFLKFLILNVLLTLKVKEDVICEFSSLDLSQLPTFIIFDKDRKDLAQKTLFSLYCVFFPFWGQNLGMGSQRFPF